MCASLSQACLTVVAADGTETFTCEPAAAVGCDAYGIVDCQCLREIEWTPCERGDDGELRVQRRE